MLKHSYNLFLEDAQRLHDFVPGTKEECKDISKIANAYIKYEMQGNKDMMSSCLSALMIRYWYMIPFLYEQCKSLRIDIDDVVNMLYEALTKAFKYKGWIDATQPVSKEENAVEKCIHQCISSVKAGAFQNSNKALRKLNYMTFSIEESVEIFGDSSECLYAEDVDEYAGVRELVENKLKSKDILSALVIDGICFCNCFDKNGFNMPKLVSIIKKDDYISLFKDRYNVDKSLSTKINNIQKSNRKVLKQLVDYAIDNLKKDKGLIYNAFGCC